MEKNNESLLPIDQKQYEEYKDEITTFLKEVTWKPDKHSSENSEIDLSFLLSSKTLNIDQQDSLSILKSAVRISDDRILLSPITNQILNIVRNGYCIGRHLGNLFSKSSGLDSLHQKNQTGRMHQSELPEFHDKLETQSAIILFVASSYISYEIATMDVHGLDSISLEFGGIPEVSLTRPTSSIRCSLYYYAAYLERSGVVKNDYHLAKITQQYFERLLDEITVRKNAFKFKDFYTNQSYKLVESNFTIHGFEPPTSHSGAKSMVFNKVEFDQIVGNTEAKHAFKRYVERLLCFDMKTGKNPMMELGGLPAITMADGKPGTGKSMMIAAVATKLQEKCKWLDIPFLFWPLPENIISTYQGGSAERAMEWFKPMQTKDKLIFAPIDDAENNLEERTRRGVSAGVREFIGVFLRNTEGAYAVNYGNKLISLFTNIPDQIDRAVLSRIQARMSMDGAETEFDFIDQDYIWWKKHKEIVPSFIDAEDPKNYDYMQAQGSGYFQKKWQNDYKIQNEELNHIYTLACKEHDPDEHAFFGHFYKLVLKQFPFFSSRDLRNIQKAIDARIIDFDFPEDWWEKEETFFKKEYNEKKNMLIELMKSNMGNQTFSSIRLNQSLYYLDNAIRIVQTGINRRIDEMSEQLYIQTKAKEKFQNNSLTSH